MTSRIVAGTCLVIALAGPAVRSAPVDEPHPFVAFLSPPTSFVAVDSTFVVSFEVGTPAEHFNGYTVVIHFDPARIQCLSVAEGSLMEQGAPSRYVASVIAESTVTYTHILLGNGLFVSGPGELSRYTFRALSPGASTVDIVSSPHCTFFDDGLCVNDDSTQAFPRSVTLTDAMVVVGGGPVDAPAVGANDDSSLHFQPNPTRGAGEFAFSARGAGPARLVVVDVTGRSILTKQWDELPVGPARFAWTGDDERGRRVPAGIYFARLEDAEGVRSARLTLLR